MPINKVVFAGNTLMDISDSNVTPETLQEGVTAYNAAGEKIMGAMSKFNKVYPVSSTDGVAYTATIDGLDELYAGLRITVIPDRVSSTKTPTLNINGTGAKNIIIPIDGVNGVITTNAAELPTWFSANHPMEIMYDGTRWRSEIKAQSAQYMYGKVPLADINSSTSDAGKTLQVGTDGVPAWMVQPIKYVESLDQNNMVNLRDLESGSYILHGYFHPYAGATNTLTFSSYQLVNIVTKTAGTHVQVFYPVDNVVQFLEIMVDSTQDAGYTYKRTNIKLSELASTTELAKYLPLAGGETMTGALDMGGNEIDGVTGIKFIGSDADMEGFSLCWEDTIYSGEFPAAQVLTFYGTAGDEPVVLRNVGDPVENTDAVNLRYLLSMLKAPGGTIDLDFRGGLIGATEVKSNKVALLDSTTGGISMTVGEALPGDDTYSVTRQLVLGSETGNERVVIANVGTPQRDTDAANKAYVLSAIQAAFDAIPSAEGVTFGG